VGALLKIDQQQQEGRGEGIEATGELPFAATAHTNYQLLRSKLNLMKRKREKIESRQGRKDRTKGST